MKFDTPLNKETIPNQSAFSRVIFTNKLYIAQSAGAVEYTDCFSVEGWAPHKECPGYDTKQPVQSAWIVEYTDSFPAVG